MSFVNINPGLKNNLIQTYTITLGNEIFFLSYDIRRDRIIWNMFMDDLEKKENIEGLLRNHLTNQ